MNHNVGMQHPAVLAFDGAASIFRDITRHNYFGFTAEVTADLTADTVFQIVAADGTEADPCVPDTPFNVKEIPLCDPLITPDTDAIVTFPAGTPAGTLCSFTIPCRPARYVSIAAVSGDTDNMRVCLTLSGPNF